MKSRTKLIKLAVLVHLKCLFSRLSSLIEKCHLLKKYQKLKCKTILSLNHILIQRTVLLLLLLFHKTYRYCSRIQKHQQSSHIYNSYITENDNQLNTVRNDNSCLLPFVYTQYRRKLNGECISWYCEFKLQSTRADAELLVMNDLPYKVIGILL